ncbi:hypothetical protein FUT69_00620 [Xylella taiwanensis]|uniref:PD-(D/E)XK nuclease-like domain-containing protein n=1 Tax=Xylella taiwanensis TaxID=1444770 RepID=Z9JM14_9GAMM|nr:PD-(D/E)XK nuclease-like domain-containing protein [Xylella taiwanensis]AXI83143.1 hypothetical protein AB672_03895 [Xylella taiwanensis]EWS78807.1 hypothetical protein AF72_04340 [Xylella taiwanensis]MCD8456192.1 PD-(D/E)XK nuclease-like domain-containing protein [Xylella taiwanensis]MCD8458600.1 PD-(D/E)XK nuclease-like domain-containing protein [Xylella taiwanensis]MCD8460734.1 PD-(D/E)XK nuclease-like domain-containing protein [Xylella taiwanensis]
MPSRACFVDLKTCNDASPGSFARSIDTYGYHIQQVHDCDGARACWVPVKNYLILGQEKQAPYCAAVYHIDAASEAKGLEIRATGLHTLARCTATEQWPGYIGITEISLPTWVLN